MISEGIQLAAAISNQVIMPNPPPGSVNPGYIDPGTGSLVIQMIIGFVVGGLVAAKIFWKRLIGFFKGLLTTSSRSDRTEN
jgi:hypothetical protein